jgi:hypothetical protein
MVSTSPPAWSSASVLIDPDADNAVEVMMGAA